MLSPSGNRSSRNDDDGVRRAVAGWRSVGQQRPFQVVCMIVLLRKVLSGSSGGRRTPPLPSPKLLRISRMSRALMWRKFATVRCASVRQKPLLWPVRGQSSAPAPHTLFVCLPC
uniref:Uncharacterized protein n=1 Tax=Plectus sambesii TaxID=2011161 RepID=A0A914W701_9BILA